MVGQSGKGPTSRRTPSRCHEGQAELGVGRGQKWPQSPRVSPLPLLGVLASFPAFLSWAILPPHAAGPAQGNLLHYQDREGGLILESRMGAGPGRLRYPEGGPRGHGGGGIFSRPPLPLASWGRREHWSAGGSKCGCEEDGPGPRHRLFLTARRTACLWPWHSTRVH